MTETSLTPGLPVCSIPEETSTPMTPAVTAASPTLSGVSPPEDGSTIVVIEEVEVRAMMSVRIVRTLWGTCNSGGNGTTHYGA